MKSKTHIHMANLLIDELRSHNNLTLPGIGAFAPPQDVRDAILNHPGAFRAGSVGPDFYPDMLLGQISIHPERSGIWLDLMFKRLLLSPLAEREKNLSFTLGYMLHYAGDMFGHAYVNTYAGGWFPPFQEIIKDTNKAKIIARHMLVESYMDQKVPKTSSMQLSPPIGFIHDVFTCQEAQGMMGAASLTNPLSYYSKLRRDVHQTLLGTGVGMTPGVTDYVQRWEEDVDTGIVTWLETWGRIADISVGDGDKKLSLSKGLLENWFIHKFTSMVGFPDFIGKVITFLNELNILKPLKDYLTNLFKDYLIALAKAILGGTYTTIEQAIEALQKALKDPKTYLDNGSVFAERNVSAKLDADFGNFGLETDATKQTFHAVLQCLNMSKLCLLGVDNLNTITKNAASSLSYKSADFAPAARIGYITVQTGTSWGAGTDNNVYIGIRQNGKIYETLCDKPGYNDFENGDLDTYRFSVPESIDLRTIDAITARMSGNTAGGDWQCSWIEIKDEGKNVLLRSNESFWLSTGNTKALTNLSRKYNIPIKPLRVDPKIMSFLWSLDGKGKDNSNPAKQAQWEIDFPIYSDAKLREKVFKPLFEIPYKPGARAITGIQANTGDIIDGVTFLYSTGDSVKIGGKGGGLSAISGLKTDERIVTASYTKCGYPYWRGCLSKVEFTTNKGSRFVFKGTCYDASRDDKNTTVVNAPAGKYIASFKGGLTTVTGTQYLSSLEIDETHSLWAFGHSTQSKTECQQARFLTRRPNPICAGVRSFDGCASRKSNLPNNNHHGAEGQLSISLQLV